MLKTMVKKVFSYYNIEIKKRADKNANLSKDVIKAIEINLPKNARPSEDEELAKHINCLEEMKNVPTSREIFSCNGSYLPCWQNSDEGLYDDWLIDDNYYPFYHALFQKLAASKNKVRLLEIGVRTGYIGVVFTKASNCEIFYLGLDPNLYVSNGLELASETFKILRKKFKNFDFVLIEGYSNDLVIQRSLVNSGPFDIIHIDGDHTLLGKLIDLELARHLIADDGIVLVDDYDHHSNPIVESVVRSISLGWFKKFAYLPTKRGLAILQK